MLLGGPTTLRTLKHIPIFTSRAKIALFHNETPIRFPTVSKAPAPQHLRTDKSIVHPKPVAPSLDRLLEALNVPLWDGQASPSPPSKPPSDHSQPQIIHDAASAYLAIRNSDYLVRQLRTSAYILLAEHAEQNQLQQIMDLLAVDLLSHFPRHSYPEGFTKAISATLSHATPKCPLAPLRVLELFQALSTSDSAKAPLLNADVLHRVVKAAIAHPDAYTSPLESLAPALLSPPSPTEQPSAKSIWITYELLMKILLQGEESYPHALAVFQQLIQAGHIPGRAQEQAEVQTGSFKIIITSTLVRGCLEFGWFEEAAAITLELLCEPQWHAKNMAEEDAQAIADIGLEVLQTLVLSPTTREVRMCRRLIRALLPTTFPRIPPPVKIPPDILFSFYDACYNRRIPDAAASVWLHLQSPAIREFHEYPPPRHSALWWLFDYFASPSISLSERGQRPMFKGSIQFARTLLGDVIRRRHPIPIMDRPRFIALAAARGFGLYARQLWEMYTVEDDRDRDVVRGNAQMLVRLVSLFRKSQLLWDEAMETKESDGAPPGDKPITVGAAPSPIIFSHDGAKDIGSETKDLPRDYWRFAERVVASYIETKQPLAMASHHDLNALARAHLLLGHSVEGIEALTFIMARGDAPDLMDINVALTGLASYSPRRAAQMIERMLKRGVVPTASTFGAVLHEALQDKDSELVERLITRARELGHGALTPKAVASLLRSTISFKFTEDKEERIRQQWAVRWALEAVETIMRYPPSQRGHKDHGKDHALSVNMGQDCVKAALNAMQPLMAFQFWMLLVKNRVRWDDREAKTTRAWIARLVRYRWRQKHLGSDKAEEILEELGMPGVDADGPRVSKPSKSIVDISLSEYNMRQRLK